MCPPFDTINALRYYSSVIRTFRDRATEAVFRRQRSRKFGPEVANRALRKLLMIDASESLDDMRVPPGNKLEKLSGDRHGQYCIRVNDQWRVCFRWDGDDAYDVEIVDYH